MEQVRVNSVRSKHITRVPRYLWQGRGRLLPGHWTDPELNCREKVCRSKVRGEVSLQVREKQRKIRFYKMIRSRFCGGFLSPQLCALCVIPTVLELPPRIVSATIWV